jgi:alkylation response protein AidB-like acyl-CoA dehydrogenase
MTTDAAESLDDAAFRRELADLLQNELPRDIAERNIQGFHQTREDVSRWQKILNKRGWGAVMWPTEFGGTGWPIRRQHEFEEACFLAGAPPQHFQNLRLVAPVVQTFGTEEQRQRFLPPMLTGDEFWAQGFSEPNAGSDLVSMRTAAVREGNAGYVINGQKLWTSDAHYCDWLILLAKTNFEGKPQRGISMFAVRLDAPGVTVRAVPGIDGAHSLNEVFLENVRVGVEDLIGEENAGWDYAKFLLAYERANTAEIPRLKRGVARIKKLAGRPRPGGQAALASEPSFPSRLAEIEIDLMALQATVWRTIDEEEGGEGSATTPSVLKIRGSELLQRINLLQAEALGEYALPFYPAPKYREGPLPGPDYAAGVMADLLYRRASTIFGGSNEIQRNLIARSVIGR